MRKSTRSGFARILAIALFIGISVSSFAGCTPESPPIKYTPTPEPTASPEPYDIEFTLPVTEVEVGKVDSTQWAAVDGLGRTLSLYGDNYESSALSGTVGEKNEKKFVGIFYSDWHEELSRTNQARNVTELLGSLSPEDREAAKHDFKNKIWKGYTGYHFWDEPLFGYYSTADTYVLRKHAELLADAGVDCIIFDNTNGSFTWEKSYMAIFETFTQAKKEGVDVPQIVFMLPFGANEGAREQFRDLYKKVYKKGLYSDLWFYWEGKPLILGYPECLGNSESDKAIKDFFTFRHNDGSYFEPDGDDSHWGWLSTYPQAVYRNADGTVEQITVGVAQNADYKRNCLSAMSGYHIMGRSYTKGDYSYSYMSNGQKVTVSPSVENSKYYGFNFQQQWDYALSVDPEFIFVTGWNEWVAMRMETWAGDKTLTNCIVDQFDTEYSRDCEPSRGEMKDYFYYQLCENIRRFKGVTKPEQLEVNRTIDITGKTSQWLGITEYSTYVNSTWVRSKENGSKGYGSKKYSSDTMRNDIITAKVAFDDKNVYFYADCANNITSYTDEGWMRLLIDTDGTGASANWEGFEFIINRVSPSSDTECTLERSKGGWNWETAGTIRYSVRGNVIQIEVPRTLLGFSEGGATPAFSFKWCDNNLTGEYEGDILSLYTDGEAAPNGRFTFLMDSKRAIVY